MKRPLRLPFSIRVSSAFLGAALCGLVAVAIAAPAQAKVFLTQPEALSLAFPSGVTVLRKTAFLTEAERQTARRLAGADRLPDALVAFYVGTRDGKEVATAYFDTHLVRTLTETVMILVDPSGAIARIETLSFGEPEEYLPRPRWYAQFSGRRLDDELSVKRGVRAVSGATLTARAATEAARRILALDKVLRSRAP
jgi:FMN-binding protein